MARDSGLAHEVRTGLKPDLKVINGRRVEGRKNPMNELSFGKPVAVHVKEFGVLFGTIFFAVAAYRGFYGRDLNDILGFFSLGAVFAVLGFAAPKVLMPVWRAWMGLAHYMGLVMTFVVMALVWCLAFVPMAFFLKLIGKRTIVNRYGSGDKSYWSIRKPGLDDFKRLERQY